MPSRQCVAVAIHVSACSCSSNGPLTYATSPLNLAYLFSKTTTHHLYDDLALLLQLEQFPDTRAARTGFSEFAAVFCGVSHGALELNQSLQLFRGDCYGDWNYDLYNTVDDRDNWNLENFSLLGPKRIPRHIDITARPYPKYSSAEPYLLFFDLKL